MELCHIFYRRDIMSVLDHVVCVTTWVTWVGGFVGPWFAWAKLLRLFVSYVGQNVFLSRS